MSAAKQIVGLHVPGPAHYMHCPQCRAHGECLAEVTVYCERCDLVWLWWDAARTWALWQVQFAIMVAGGLVGRSWWRLCKRQ